MAVNNPFFAGLGLAFFVIAVEASADVLVSYIPVRQQHKTLQGWVESSTGA